VIETHAQKKKKAKIRKPECWAGKGGGKPKKGKLCSTHTQEGEARVVQKCQQWAETKEVAQKNATD